MVVCDRLYRQFQQEVGALKEATAPFLNGFDAFSTDATLVDGRRLWLPMSRDPRDLMRYARGEAKRLTQAARTAAQLDVAALAVPATLSYEHLRAHVRTQLLQHTIVARLREELAVPLRFGAVVTLVQRWTGLAREDAAQAWQTLMRWLRYFQPELWSYVKPRHSEILVYSGGDHVGG